EDCIRDRNVTGVQTCALPISLNNVGKISSKDEVVYATLSATGDEQEIYVVNTLDVTKEGKIVDYGSYSSIKNLTNLSDIEQSGRSDERRVGNECSLLCLFLTI